MQGVLCCSTWLLGNSGKNASKNGKQKNRSSSNSSKKEKRNGLYSSKDCCKHQNIQKRDDFSRLERALKEGDEELSDDATCRDWWVSNRSADEATRRAASVAYSIAVETSSRATVAGGLVDLLEQAIFQFQCLHDLTGEMNLELEWASLKLTLLQQVKLKFEMSEERRSVKDDDLIQRGFSGSLLKIVRTAALQLDETICICSSASSDMTSAALFVKSDTWFAKWAAVQDDVNKASDHLLFAMINEIGQKKNEHHIALVREEKNQDVKKAIQLEICQQNEAFVRAVISVSSILSSEEKAIYSGLVLHSASFELPSETRENLLKVFKKLANDDIAGAISTLHTMETKLRPSPDSEDYEHRAILLFIRGLATYREKNDEKALALYHDAIIADPDCAECWFAMALSLQRAEYSIEQQVAAYKRCLELDNDFALAHLKYGLILADRRAYDAAEKELEMAAHLDANNGDTLLAFAEFETDIRQNHQTAEKYVQKALQVAPRNSRAHNLYAMLLLHIKQNYFLAEKHFRLALEADSCNAIARNNYAHLLAQIRKNYDDAEMHYRLAVEADPKLAIAHYNYANLLKTIRCDYDLAQKHYELAIEYEPMSALAHNNLANLYYDIRKDPDKAQHHYELALLADPKNASAHTNLGLLKHVVRQQYDEAEKHYKSALAVNATHADAHNNLGYLLQTVRGNFDLAEKHYQAALESDPNHAFTHESYGELLFDVHHAYDDAENHLKLALDQNPNLLTAHLKLGELYLHVRDDPELALDFLSNALELDPNNTSALYNIASLYEQRGALKQAALYLERLVVVLSSSSSAQSDQHNKILSDDDLPQQRRSMLEDINKRLALIIKRQQQEET
mmetsp:Transcript_2412/g.3861  ORF Transcript_2412/g.3861 Transcript_2412/m.3861 type:complete len:855 (+) Transcript_2412:47-2611(+)